MLRQFRSIATWAAFAAIAFAGARDPALGMSPTVETPHYRIFQKGEVLDEAGLSALSANREAAYERILYFLGNPDPSLTINYHIYPSFEDKGLQTGNTELSHLDRQKTAVHTVINDWIRGDDSTLDAMLLLRTHLGQPAVHVLELGLAVYVADNWRSSEYDYWAARLYESGNMVPLRILLDNNLMARESYLIKEPLAGTFVATAVQLFGREALLSGYADWRPQPEEIERLETEWHRYLETLVEQYRSRIKREKHSFPMKRGFKKGFCHAHMGYRIFDGYGSRKSDRAIEKLHDMGTNAVSITPFSYMRDPRKPSYLPISRRSGHETDESILHAARVARSLGMSVMLKPHIWLGHKSWPGEIEMQTDADWDRFFNYYYRWIRHYAMLAEMYHFDILCIGVELSRTTTLQPDRWRTLIKRIRRLYSGQLTYAANWGEEFESIDLWKDLDYIGVNCYYPLSESDTPTTEDLALGARDVMARVEAVSRRYSRQVLFTEIGFASTAAPWKRPHESSRGRKVNLGDQARCYEAVFSSLYGQRWCAGIYWWKWPSFLEYGGPDNSDFTPNAKPAEAVVRSWFARDW